ncbi:PVC-type heme-binding CxxCH protein [Aquisphaera insulae]|uniref:PVC-type heme-binding CxxCH protein n=1 Tax=Aquisphaera insulae TaxID=2712864 RepID=UPI0013EC3981|nr:PVC-type heme-binding CxxCH protein [Aquisphaera insulae]
MNTSARGGRSRGRGPILVVGLSLLSGLVGISASAPAGEFKIGERTLKVPDGFVAELVAGPPVTDRPITVAFDEAGALYVADSSGSNDPVQKQLVERTHRIVKLQDKDGDGRYETRTVFADRMMFPEGTLWHDGSLFVAAPPSIWKLTDTDGDGVADRREEWLHRTLTGCANDLHGPYLGPDGRIYWCKGAFAEQRIDRPGKAPYASKASHIFRARPDGSEIEPVMTGGMDNPVDVTFTPGGDRIFTCTFLQQPGGGKRDGLIHAIYGGIYGKVHSPIFEPGHRWTGPEVMPVLLHMGPAAPAGLNRHESDALGPEYRDNLFACYFNLHKVSRHVLKPEGSTFTATEEPFVTSPDVDFHPTDVVEDADGSLVVVDTGGWYKLCCPSSQIQKPDVLGAVYRVRRKDAPRVADPRGLAIDWKGLSPDDLAKLLGDPRPAVQHRAIEALGKRGEAAILALAPHNVTSPLGRRNAVWTAARIEAPVARSFVRSAIEDPDPDTARAAIQVASLHRDRDAVALLVAKLGQPSAHGRRAAAEALGRIGDPSAVPALLQGLADKTDRQLEHALIYAAIEIGDRDAAAKAVQSPNPAVRRGAIIALDQMEGGSLDPREVAGLLTSTDPPLREAASWILGRHPEWGGALAGSCRERLAKGPAGVADGAELERLLARFAGSAEIQALLAEVLADATAPAGSRLIAARAMARAGLKDAPGSWIASLTKALATRGEKPEALELTRQGVATAAALATSADRGKPLIPVLTAIGRDGRADEALRLAALAAVPGGVRPLDDALLGFLVEHLDRDQPSAIRGSAAAAIAAAGLSAAQLKDLTAAFRTAGPLEVDRLLTAFEQSTDEAVGLGLVKALGESPSLSSLRAELIKQHLAKYGAPVQAAAEAVYAKLNADAAKQRARVDDLCTKLAGGDVRKGQAVFLSEKASCFTCHAIGYRGGDVGPDLTKIGEIRTERDLLEAIVFPSASLVRSFEPIVVATSDGKVTSGLLKRETSDELFLVTGVNQEARIARSDVEEIRPGTVSVMPAGLDQQLTERDLADLVAFLKACR